MLVPRERRRMRLDQIIKGKAILDNRKATPSDKCISTNQEEGFAAQRKRTLPPDQAYIRVSSIICFRSSLSARPIWVSTVFTEIPSLSEI